MSVQTRSDFLLLIYYFMLLDLNKNGKYRVVRSSVNFEKIGQCPRGFENILTKYTIENFVLNWGNIN